VAGHVRCRDVERVLADVGRVHRGLWKRQRAGDRDAAAAGAKIEDARRARVVEPRRKTVLDQLADRRARDQHPRVDGKAQPGEPGLAGQVRRRQALADAPLQQRGHRRPLLGRQCGVQKFRRQRQIQVQHMRDQHGRLVGGAVRSMAKK
jgi:hypothetical protein